MAGLRGLARQVMARFEGLYGRYSRLFWTLHSIWALLWGAGVLVLAHNRHGYLPWVVSFLALTWATTLFFTRATSAVQSTAMRYAQEFVSYLTRVMYQGTLFFLIPFYAYSATFFSPNTLFVAFLLALAIFSCIDLPFDHLLRRYRSFALTFFVLVTFAALNFFFPLIFKTRLHIGTYLAAALAVGAALPLAYPPGELLRRRVLLKAVVMLLAALVAARAARPLVPPVPLRLTKVRFAAQLDLDAPSPRREWSTVIPASELTLQKLYVVATIFSPTSLPTTVTIKVKRAGVVVRSSRVVELLAHEKGFRVWDVVPLARLAEASSSRRPHGPLVVEVWTAEGHLIGRTAARIE